MQSRKAKRNLSIYKAWKGSYAVIEPEMDSYKTRLPTLFQSQSWLWNTTVYDKVHVIFIYRKKEVFFVLYVLFYYKKSFFEVLSLNYRKAHLDQFLSACSYRSRLYSIILTCVYELIRLDRDLWFVNRSWKYWKGSLPKKKTKSFFCFFAAIMCE